MKIRINCTTQEHLQLNNKKINLKNYNRIDENRPDNFDYISKINMS